MSFDLLGYRLRKPLNDYQTMINLPRILAVTILVSFVGAALIVIPRLIIGVGEAVEVIISVGIVMLISLAMFVLNRFGYHFIAGWVMILTIGAALTYNLIRFNGIYDVGILGYPAVIVFGSMLFGRRSVAVVTGISCIAITLVYWSSVVGYTVPFYTLGVSSQDYFSNLVFLVVTGGLVHMIMGMIEGNISRVLISERNLQQAYEKTLKGWSVALELRDYETQGHTQRVTELCARLAEEFGFSDDELKYVRWGALLHDIGKMGIPDRILLKPGKLTQDEYDFVKQHTSIAMSLLQGIPYLEPALVIPQAHHEKFDGSGYPNGLHGEEIPLEARIFTIVDVYDALLSERPYSPAWTKEAATAYILAEAGRHFDPNVVEVFLKLV